MKCRHNQSFSYQSIKTSSKANKWKKVKEEENDDDYDGEEEEVEELAAREKKIAKLREIHENTNEKLPFT